MWLQLSWIRNAIVTIAKTEGPKLLCLVIKRHCFVIYHSVPYNFHFTRLSVNGPFIQNNGSDDLSISMELLTGAAAGGLAGTLTTP